MTRVFGGLYPLLDSQIDNDSPAMAEIARAVVGNAASLYELATGQPCGDGGAVSPPNPQGELGVDLSGPPWGSALLHPIAWMGGGTEDAANIHGCKVVGTCSSAGIGPLVNRWRFWVRPHALLPNGAHAPYSRAYPRIRAAIASGTGTLTLRVGSLDGSETFAEMTVSVTSTSPTDYDFTGFIPLVSGWNTLRLTWHVSASTVTIYSVSLNVAAKRAH